MSRLITLELAAPERSPDSNRNTQTAAGVERYFLIAGSTPLPAGKQEHLTRGRSPSDIGPKVLLTFKHSQPSGEEQLGERHQGQGNEQGCKAWVDSYFERLIRAAQAEASQAQRSP